MEEKIRFTAGRLTLEGLFSRGAGRRGAVITHPHPLYGGEMRNPVVECLQMVYRARGFTTLRFNFRGVGNSEGVYADGTGELDDVLAAADYLSGLGISGLDLAGYSFGAWVNAKVPSGRTEIRRSIMVSPPVAFVDFSPIHRIPTLSLVVTGSRDEIAPAAEIVPMLGSWNPEAAFEIIEGADHFFWGHLDALQEVLEQHVHPEATDERTP
jgi:alpha/beta superfamily hydrolase